jgi:hypothetical protein
VASFFVVDARTQHTFLLGTRDIAKKPFHERHLAKSGFGKPKAAKLDNPSDAGLRERGHGAVLGDEGKAVGRQSADGFAVCVPCRFQPPWSVEEQDACYVIALICWSLQQTHLSFQRTLLPSGDRVHFRNRHR